MIEDILQEIFTYAIKNSSESTSSPQDDIVNVENFLRATQGFLNKGHVPHVPVPSTSKVIACDVREMETCVLVYVDLPGVDRTSIDLSVDDKDHMVMRVNRKLYSESSDVFHLKERYEGAIEKRVKLPAKNLDKTSIKASYEDGVLKVEIKKLISGQNSTRIPIS